MAGREGIITARGTEDVRAPVAVEIAAALGEPRLAGIEREIAAPGDRRAVHLPDRDRPVVVLPQDVGPPVGVEVGRDQRAVGAERGGLRGRARSPPPRRRMFSSAPGLGARDMMP